MVYTLNYVTCIEIFGSDMGISLIKYYDTQYLFSIIFGVVLNFLFPMNDSGLTSIIVLLFFQNVGACLMLFCFPKKQIED